MLALAHPLTAAALVEGLEGGALTGLSAYAIAGTVVGGSVDVTVGLALAAVTGMLGIGALLASGALYRARRWARAPAVLTQFLAIPIAASLWQGGQAGVGIPLLIIAVLGLALLLHPTTTKKLVGS